MLIDDPNDMDDIERQIKFAELAAQFGRSIAAMEVAPIVSHHELLARDGLVLPPATELEDDTVTAKLWEIIESLARRNIYLACTDHLSDRELYAKLVDDVLWEGTKDYAAVLDEGELRKPGFWSCTLEVCDGSDPADEDDFLRYFADESHREEAKGYREAPLPEPAEPPHDRDRFLPVSPDRRLHELGEAPSPEEVFDEGEIDPSARDRRHDGWDGDDDDDDEGDDLPF